MRRTCCRTGSSTSCIFASGTEEAETIATGGAAAVAGGSLQRRRCHETPTDNPAITSHIVAEATIFSALVFP
jgi:hypothetical protein